MKQICNKAYGSDLFYGQALLNTDIKSFTASLILHMLNNN